MAEDFDFVAQLVTREYARRRRQEADDLIDHRLDARPMPPVEQVRDWCETFARAADERDATTLNALVAEVAAWRSPARPWDDGPTSDLTTAGLSEDLAKTLADDLGLPRVKDVVDALLNRRVMLLSRGLSGAAIKEIRKSAERLRNAVWRSWGLQDLPDTDYPPSRHPAGRKHVRLWTRRFAVLARDNTHPAAMDRLVREVVNWTPDVTPWEDRPVWQLAESEGGKLPDKTVVKLRDEYGCETVLDVLTLLVFGSETEMAQTRNYCPSWSLREIDLAVNRHHARVQKELDGAAKLSVPAAQASGTGIYDEPPATALTTPAATCRGTGTYRPPRPHEAA